MIIYRPHKGGFTEAMNSAVEFTSESDMFDWIVKDATRFSIRNESPFCSDDLIVCGAPVHDARNGWQDTRYVCTKRYFQEVYSTPQVVGFCATKYK